MKQLPVILLAFANSRGDSELRYLGEEMRNIKAAMKKAEEEGLCKIVTCAYAKLKDITDAFRTYKDRIAIFHFAGHANDYTIRLEDPFGENNSIYADGFAAYLGDQKGLQLVFLNGCATEKQGNLLQKQGIPAVIITENKVKDDVAMQLATDFYEEIGIGRSIGEAYATAINLLKSQGKQKDLVYRDAGLRRGVLKRQTDNWVLKTQQEIIEAANWNLPEVANHPLYPYPLKIESKFSAHPFPAQRAYTLEEGNIFWGRDYEIGDFLEALFSKDAPDLFLLYGASGVGKTSFIQAGVLTRILKAQLLLNSVGEEASLVEALKKVTLKFDENESAYQFIIIEANQQPSLEIGSLLNQLIIASKHRLKCILVMQTAELAKWTLALDNLKNCAYNSIYLPPLSQAGMQQFFDGLVKNYNTSIEVSLIPQIINHFLSDPKAPITALFQIFLKQLWEKAKAIDNSKPHLSLSLYRKNYTQIWKNFIQTQLKSIDASADESGLLLNILKDCGLEYGAAVQQTLAIEQITDKYPHLNAPIDKLLQDLVNKRILSDPALDQLETSNQLKIRHTLLNHIIWSLFTDSNKTGQEVRQLLQHHLAHGSKLTQTELDKVEANRQTIPNLSPAQETLLQTSHRVLKTTDRKATVKKWKWRVIFCLLLLFSFFSGNVYLLVLLVLLVGLYW